MLFDTSSRRAMAFRNDHCRRNGGNDWHSEWHISWTHNRPPINYFVTNYGFKPIYIRPSTDAGAFQTTIGRGWLWDPVLRSVTEASSNAGSCHRAVGYFPVGNLGDHVQTPGCKHSKLGMQMKLSHHSAFFVISTQNIQRCNYISVRWNTPVYTLKILKRALKIIPFWCWGWNIQGPHLHPL